MRAPAGLDRAGKRAHRFAVETLERLGEDPTTSRAAVERFAVLHDRLALAQERWTALGRPLTATGSKGQEQAHPLLRLEADLRREVLAVEDALGLNVAARAALGRRQSLRAADRRAVRSRPGAVISLAEVVRGRD
jgi:P27 family predicted phage terminase small subunit